MFKYFIAIVLLMFGVVKADPLQEFVDTLQAQEIASQWVMLNSDKSLTVSQSQKIVSEVYAASQDKNINPLLVLAVIKTESNFKASAKSKYAKGLMQVIPSWHKDKIAGRNLFAVATSIDVGTTILKDCLTKHKGVIPKALSCYSGSSSAYYKKVMKLQYALSESVSYKATVVASR